MAYGKSQDGARREDQRLVTGKGRYLDDIELPGMVHAAMVYSDHAHGKVRKIETDKARGASGVIAVFTGADAEAGGLHPIAPRYLPQMFGLGEALPIPRPCLVTDRVRHVGDRVAVVIAQTRAQAEAAAELVDVDIDPLPHSIGIDAALDDSATPVHDERPDNIAYKLEMGDRTSTDEAFAGAASIHRITYHHPRVAATSMETRCGIGVYDEGEDSYTLHTSTQNPHLVRSEIANLALRVNEANVRVISHDVGGGFGMKTSTYPEDALLLWVAKQLGRPVKWVCSRADALRTDEQGRGNQGKIEIALDENARLLGLRARIAQDVGAYMVCAATMPLIHTARLLPGVYDIPAVHCEGIAVFTNQTTVVPYRGAGRPEGNFAVEQALDQAARDLDISPVEIRRKNFISPDQMPHLTQVNFTYDTGEFEPLMDQCLAAADWDGFEKRRDEDAKRGLLRGRGLGMYIHDTGSMNEQVDIMFTPGGTVRLVTGSADAGQGHKTTFANQVARRCGIDPADIQVMQGDTEKVGFGRGAFASRSVTMVGSAIEVACDTLIERGRDFAAMFLEVERDGIEFDAETGLYRDTASNKSMTITEIAKASFRPYLPVSNRIGLSAVGAFKIVSPSFSNGCHIAEVTIDTETGETRIGRYTIVDDLGNMLEPVLCEGQIHGALAMGIGESVMEHIASDPSSGALLSGTLMDYALPRAADIPDIATGFRPVPCTTNPGGFKGAGEGGTVGSISALKHAVLDALAPLGVTDIPKPMTSARIWMAIKEAMDS